MDRLVTIVKALGKLTSEEKLELKSWLANTLNEEIKEEAKLEGKLVAKLELAKELLDVLDDETIAVKTKLPLEKIKELRRELC